ADRRAQHRLDVAEPHALALAEALVEEGRRRDYRPPRGDRLGDDAARDRDAHARELLGGEAVRERPGRAGEVVAVQLEVALTGLGDFDDQAERLAQERPGLVAAAEIEQAAIEVALAPDPGQLLAAVGHGDCS